MAWYEYLLGILTIFTFISWILVIAAIRVGAMADARPIEPALATTKRKHPEVTIAQALNRDADKPLLQQQTDQTPCSISDKPDPPAKTPPSL